MRVGDRHYRSIWLAEDGRTVQVIDQTRLPHEFRIANFTTCAEIADAIKTMVVRGAPLIGATAAYGVALQMADDPSDAGLDRAYTMLKATRPTAVNLVWALEEMRRILLPLPPASRGETAYAQAARICDEDIAINRSIGMHGLRLIEDVAKRKTVGQPVNILTHCNAGWLATVDWGTATTPIYSAVERGIDVHVYVDETRPRNQGAHLTAWEMLQHRVPHTLIVDNAGGHLMQHRKVDMVIVGCDRATSQGDVCNKIGTYLKALAAHDNGVPFYVALPSPTIDWNIKNGVAEVPIEERSGDEVACVSGRADDGLIRRVRISPEGTASANPAFDVTPARLVTGLITERGVCQASFKGLTGLFPEGMQSKETGAPRLQRAQ